MRVAAANRAAAVTGGIVPGLALADARTRLPDLRVVAAAPEDDRRALAALADGCGRYTPWTALDSGGLGAALGADYGLWLDITGCAHLFGGEAALLEALLRRLAGFGFAARAAVAETPGAAWAMARYGGGTGCIVVPPGGGRAALAALPPAALRLTAAEVEGLERLGLRRIEALYDLPRGALTKRFDARLVRRLDQALGHLAEPISPRRAVAPYLARLAFAEPIGGAEAIAAASRRLLGALEGQLARAGRGARRLELSLYRVDGTVVRAEVGTSAPVREPDHLMGLLGEKLDGLDAGFGVELITLAAPVSERLAAAQLDLDGVARAQGAQGAQRAPAGQGAAGGAGAGGAGADDTAELGRLVDRLGNRFGLRNVLRFAPRQSHVPERAAVPVEALAPPAPWSWPTGKARPLRLLPRPEAIEAVAMVPDDPPMMFRWRRVLHRVAKADGPERIAAEWWRRAQAGREDAVRDYYRVEDEQGRRFWLYRDGLYRPGASPHWYLHGLFG